MGYKSSPESLGVVQALPPRPAGSGLTRSIGNQAGDGRSGVLDTASSGPAPRTEGLCLPGSIPPRGVTAEHPLQGYVIPVPQASRTR